MWTAPGDTVYISEVHKLAKWTTDTNTATTATPGTSTTAAAPPAASPTRSTKHTIPLSASTGTPTNSTVSEHIVSCNKNVYNPLDIRTGDDFVSGNSDVEEKDETKALILQLLNECLNDRFGPSITTTSTTAATQSTDHPQGAGVVDDRDVELTQPSLPFFDPLLCPPPPPTSSQSNSSSGHKNEWNCGIVVCIPLRLGEGSTIAPIYIEV